MTIYRGYDITKQDTGFIISKDGKRSVFAKDKEFATEEEAQNRIDAYRATIARMANDAIKGSK